jgi:hypothetical protein
LPFAAFAVKIGVFTATAFELVPILPSTDDRTTVAPFTTSPPVV